MSGRIIGRDRPPAPFPNARPLLTPQAVLGRAAQLMSFSWPLGGRTSTIAHMEWAVVLATFFGPIFAVQAQKWIESARNARERREAVFKALMSSRGAGLSPKHVEALNMISLEFPADRFRAVNEAWRTYHAHLSEPVHTDTAAASVWSAKQPDLLTNLLAAMASALGYRFGETDIKKGSYAPMQYMSDEQEQRRLRAAFIDVLTGKTSVKTDVASLPKDVRDEPI